MSKIKNGGLDQYGAGPFKQQQFGTAGVEGVNIIIISTAQVIIIIIFICRIYLMFSHGKAVNERRVLGSMAYFGCGSMR